MKYDLLVVGGGPAGPHRRHPGQGPDKSVLVVSNQPTASPLCKAPRMDNYPGIPHVSGLELVERLLAQAKELGAEIRQGRVLNQMSLGGSVMASIGDQVEEASAAILAVGVARATPLKGERAAAGPGCELLRHLRRHVLPGQAHRGGRQRPGSGGGDGISALHRLPGPSVRLPGLEILGEEQVTGVRTAAGEEIPCEGVFLLRASIAPPSWPPAWSWRTAISRWTATWPPTCPGSTPPGTAPASPSSWPRPPARGQTAAHFACRRSERRFFWETWARVLKFLCKDVNMGISTGTPPK